MYKQNKNFDQFHKEKNRTKITLKKGVFKRELDQENPGELD